MRVAGGAVRSDHQDPHRLYPLHQAPHRLYPRAAHLAAPHHTHTLHPLRDIVAASARCASHAAQHKAALLCLWSLPHLTTSPCSSVRTCRGIEG